MRPSLPPWLLLRKATRVSLANAIYRPSDFLGKTITRRKQRFTGRKTQLKQSMACMKPVALPTGCEIEIPHRLVNEANRRDHWSCKADRTKSTRNKVNFALCLCRGLFPSFPCHVTMIRRGPREMDSDGLSRSCKAVRDEVAAFSGIDDRDSNGWVWEPKQEKCKEYSVVLRLEAI